MLTISMEEGRFIMSKRDIILVSVQLFLILVAFLFVFVDFVQFKDIESIQYENEILKEEISNLETEYLEITKEESLDSFKVEEEEQSSMRYPSLYGLLENKEKLEKKIEELEGEITDYEAVKTDWNNKIADLEK